MARMHPESDNCFHAGNSTNPGDVIPDCNCEGLAEADDILLILTVDNYGRVTAWNHPNTDNKEKLRDITKQLPYPNQGIWDVTNVTLATYISNEFPNVVELGIWNPGPPRRMVS
jgi:hypothetical protein